MRILGIDTATWRASVGLIDGDNVVAEKTIQTTGNHAASLLPLIDSLLVEAGCDLGSIDAWAVSTGPGSFTGLRVGLSVAKALAWTGQKRLMPVSTLAALAHAGGERAGSVAAVLDARKGELYAALFEWRDGRCERQSADALVTPDDLLTQLPQPCTVIGDATERYGEFFRTHLRDNVVILSFPEFGPRGSSVARLAAAGVQAPLDADFALLEPSYIRPPDAVRQMIVTP